MYLITKELFDILEGLDIGSAETAYLDEDSFGNCAVFTNYNAYIDWWNWSCCKIKPNLKRWYSSYYLAKATIQDERVRDIFLTK